MHLQSYLCLYILDSNTACLQVQYLYTYITYTFLVRFGLKVNHTTVHVHINFCRRHVKMVYSVQKAGNTSNTVNCLNVEDIWNLSYSHDGVLVLSSPVTGLSGLLIGLSISHTPLPPAGNPPLLYTSCIELIPIFCTLSPRVPTRRSVGMVMSCSPTYGEGHESLPEGV